MADERDMPNVPSTPVPSTSPAKLLNPANSPDAGEVDALRADADWPAYFDAVAGLPARDSLLFALNLFSAPSAPSAANLFAIDLGCGSGRDTLELLRRGWRVLAIDSHPEGIARLRSAADADGLSPHLKTLISRFEDAPLPPCDLINASFSIPHCSPADFPTLWSRITDALRKGGRFAGQLFGVNDGWAARPDGITRTYHTRRQVDAMLAPFHIELLDEIQRDGKTALGEPKYWHVFHIVARKPEC